MKSKWLIYTTIVGFLGVSIIGALWGFGIKSYHIQIPVKFGSASTPYADVEIEGKKYLLEFDLGSKFQLSLRKSFLEKIIKKEPHGIGEWKDINGNKYEAPSYLIPEMRIGDLILANVVVQEDDDDFIFNATMWDGENKGRDIVDKEQGVIGRPLLEKVNLLLDFGHSTIFASNDKNKLKKAGYCLDHMTKVPFELGRMGIILQVDTDIGIKRLSIDTGSSLNLIRSSLLKDHECQKGQYNIPFFITSKFIIGGEDFGSMCLHLHKITPELNELDGFLGAPFLESHVLYIDFPHKVVYIGNSK